MQRYLSDTREMIRNGNYKEALNREIWFHAHALEYNKSMTGVRLSFALSDWKGLGEKYPPALAALIKIRDDKTKLIKINGGPSSLFQDVAAINRELKEDAKTIYLFKIVIKTHPDMAKSNWHYVKKQLFAAKAYNIIQQYIGTPYSEYSNLKRSFDSNAAYYPKMGENASSFKALIEKNFIIDITWLLQYCLAIHDNSSAKELQHLADQVISDGRIEEALKD